MKRLVPTGIPSLAITEGTTAPNPGNTAIVYSTIAAKLLVWNGTFWTAPDATTVSLASQVVNTNATANTIANITGLSFPVTAGLRYKFYFFIMYNSVAVGTGARFSISGPAAPTLLSYYSRYTLTAVSETVNYANAYDMPAAANASALTTGNIAFIEGMITPSATGVVIARFASEVASSAITVLAGSYVNYQIL